MGAWSEAWDKEISQRLKRWDHRRMLLFAAACIDHAALHLWGSLKKRLAENRLQIVRSALDTIWTVAHRKGESDSRINAVDEIVEMLEAAVPGDDDPEILIAGWANLLNGLSYTLICAQGKEPAEYCLAAAGYAYQCIFEEQILFSLTTPADEHEVKRLEVSNPVCLSEIEFQLEAARCVTDGALLNRGRLP